MRVLGFLTVLLLTTCHAVPAFARDASACYAVGDADGRAYCLAQARQDPAMCYSIQSSALRAQCLAEVRK